MTEAVAASEIGALSALRRAGPLAIAGMVANGSNVIVTVVIAHLLSSRGYGSLTELVAIFLVLSMPGSALLVAVVRRVTAWQAVGRQTEAHAWVVRVRHIGALALGAWMVIAVAVRSPLSHLVGLPGPAGTSEVLVAGGAWALLCVERGLIQSRRAYGPLGRNLIVEGTARAVLTVLLVKVGLGVEGAALALVAAMAAALIDARISLGPIDGSAGDVPAASAASEQAEAAEAAADITASPADLTASAQRLRSPGRRTLLTDLLTALGALALLAGLQNLDVLVVGHQNPSASGPYGAISVSSKAVVFAALVLCGYLLPEAVRKAGEGSNALRQLVVALGLVAIPVAGLVGVALLNPTLLLRVAFGPDKTAAHAALATMAAAMGCLAGSVLLTHYLLGFGRRRVVAVLALALGVLVAAVAAAHGAALATARTELGVQSVLAVVLAVMVLRLPRGPSRPATARQR
jgi:O-antigen/teichoic acid export membrane protein